ncbi:MAG: GNAT family N-acetyltransferase [bacterium]
MTEFAMEIRTASLDEVELAVDWAADEGWNPGLHDAKNYLQADPNGFLIGYLGDDPVAVISAIRYPGDFGFLGFYIVKPDFRGQGLGITIWNAAISYLEGCNIGLDGVVEQQANYAKSGFKLAYRNIRYQHVAHSVSQASAIKPVAELPIDDLLTYERAFFPVPREGFVKAWLDQADSHALAHVEGADINGYGVIRRCREGYKVGPLVADSPVIAGQLLDALQSTIPPGESVYLDVPEVNTAAVKLATSLGMSKVFETARMYTGKFPDVDLPRTYGVTSFEIG